MGRRVVVVMYSVLKEHSSFQLYIASCVIAVYAHNSMSCYVWLNFYYYTQIVPAQRAVLMWIKRNIKSFIYGVLITDGMLSFFSCAVFAADALFVKWSFSNGTRILLRSKELHSLNLTSSVMMYVHMLLCLCIMMVSSISTAHYLNRHMRNMIQSGSTFSTPRLRSQMRVSITGILQGVLCFLYDSFYLIDAFIFILPTQFSINAYVSITVTMVYVSGTSLNLGIGQTIFRENAADAWKALKAALCGVGMATDNVKLHSCQLTAALNQTFTMDKDMSLRLENSLKTHADVVTTVGAVLEIYVCVCVMVVSSGATVANGGKSTVALLLSMFQQPVLISPFVYFTVTNLYMWGTTCNLGAGHAVFRQRAAHIWAKVAQWCSRLNKESDS
ncbi:uncharacterized protein LOC114426918 [Parambassis ranga]|uniref:Taste receptor type 2 member 40 n=1 Tax=Parambassis ranga TaxID=210632 RepID=A0A6P7H801_9TELE|nr:uncharacterized protein LOC114426918 [Parambassis ranga]